MSHLQVCRKSDTPSQISVEIRKSVGNITKSSSKITYIHKTFGNRSVSMWPVEERDLICEIRGKVLRSEGTLDKKVYQEVKSRETFWDRLVRIRDNDLKMIA